MLDLKTLVTFINEIYGEIDMALFSGRTYEMFERTTTTKYNYEYSILKVISFKYESEITGGTLSVTIEVDKCEEKGTVEKKSTD